MDTVTGKRVLVSDRLGLYKPIFEELGIPFEERVSSGDRFRTRYPDKRNLESLLRAKAGASYLMTHTTPREERNYFAGISTGIHRGLATYPGSGGLDLALGLLGEMSGSVCRVDSFPYIISEEGWSNDVFEIRLECELSIRTVTKSESDHESGRWQHKQLGPYGDQVGLLCEYDVGTARSEAQRRMIPRLKVVFTKAGFFEGPAGVKT